MAHHDEAGDRPSKALSDHVERIDGSLLWRTEWRRATREEFAALGSPEQTGRRVVETITAWLAHAFESLPPDKQAELRIDLERPDWVDIEHPEHALHELQRLAASMQGYVTKAHWKSEGWTDDQWRALGVLQAIRGAIKTTHGLEARQALPLIDALLNVGVTVSKAHTVPWEPVARTGLLNRTGGNKGRETRTSEAAEMRQKWRNRAAELLEANPRLKKTDLSEKIASEWNQGRPLEERRSAGTIRNAL